VTRPRAVTASEWPAGLTKPPDDESEAPGLLRGSLGSTGERVLSYQSREVLSLFGAARLQRT
jgi:hypothetical protein